MISGYRALYRLDTLAMRRCQEFSMLDHSRGMPVCFRPAEVTRKSVLTTPQPFAAAVEK